MKSTPNVVWGFFEPDPFTALPHARPRDGWENETTGLGTYQRDKSMAARFERREEILSLNWTLLENLYHEDDISGRIVDIIPDHMFRRGWDVQVEKDTQRTQSAEFTKYATKLQLKKRMKEATTWGRLKGGALLVLGIDDGRPIDQPVDEANIRSIKYLNVVERQYILANTYYTDPFTGKANEPATYMITNSLQMGPSDNSMEAYTSTYVVHESRTIRFEGANTSKIERQRLGGWTHTVLQRPYEKIKAFVQGFQAAGNLMTDASQGVYKLEGLISQIAGNEVQDIQTRMMWLDMTRSVARAIVLDKEGEEFERNVATITGYPEMLDRFMMLLSAATEIPVTILMGRSAAGMNATGDSDFRQLYSVISNKQENDLEPQLQRAYRYISLAKDGPTKGEEASLTFKFRSLWEPTLMEQAQINQIQSAADLNYVTMGAATGEEIAISRFADGEINLTTKIDMEGRQESQEAGELYEPYHGEDDTEAGASGGELDLKRQGNTPPAPPPPTAPGQAMTGRGSKVHQVNSSQPGNKSGSGR